jgi:hypothetical protein
MEALACRLTKFWGQLQMRERGSLTFPDRSSLNVEAAQGSHRATEVQAAGSTITVSRLQILSSQQRSDPLTP